MLAENRRFVSLKRQSENGSSSNVVNLLDKAKWLIKSIDTCL